MRRDERARFDELLERVMSQLPEGLRQMIAETPVVVEDHPSPELLRELGISGEDDGLCGLHSGIPLTERSVAHPSLPDVVTLYREGIVDEAGGWDEWTDDGGQRWGGEQAVAEEIRITLLHELGHHFGMTEEDLEKLGYG